MFTWVNPVVLCALLTLGGCTPECKSDHRFKVGDIVQFKGLGAQGVVVGRWRLSRTYDLYMEGYGIERQIPEVILEPVNEAPRSGQDSR